MSVVVDDEENNRVTTGAIIGGVTYSLIHFTAFIIALYLSFQRNKGFDLGSFIFAFCCPYIYIIYYFATNGKKSY